VYLRGGRPGQVKIEVSGVYKFLGGV